MKSLVKISSVIILINLWLSNILLAHSAVNNANNQQKNTTPIALTKVNQSNLITTNKVANITKKTTKKDLIRMFGKSNLSDDKIAFFGGDVELFGTKIKGGKGKNPSLVVLWNNQKQKEVSGVMILDPKYKTIEGIGVGTSLNTLRAKAGEFKLNGFGWDYGGIVNFNNTKLAKYRKITIQMAESENAYNKYPNEAQKVLGDIELKSSDPILQKLDVTVWRMMVFF